MTPSSAEQASVQKQFEIALALQSEGRIEASEEILQKLETVVPTSALVVAARAFNARKSGKMEQAENLLAKASSLDPSNVQIALNLGSLFLHLNKFEQAFHLLHRLTFTHSNNPEVHYLMGRCLEEQKDFRGALSAFNKSIGLDKLHAHAHGRIISCLIALDLPEAAVNAARESISKGLNTFEILYSAGCAWAVLGEHETALVCFDTASAKAPERMEPKRASANSLFKLRRSTEGLKTLLDLASDRPDDLALHSELNRRAWTSGDAGVFLKSYDHIESKAGMLPHDLWVQKIELLLLAGRIVEALEQTERAAKFYQSTPALLWSQANAVAKLGQWEKADSLYEMAHRANPDDVLLARDFAYWMLRRHQFDTALKLLTDLVNKHPHDQMAIAGRVSALRLMGRGEYESLLLTEHSVKVLQIPVPPGFSTIEQFNEALKEQLLLQHSGVNSPLDQTLHGGTQTEGMLFEQRNPLVVALRRSLESAVSGYILGLPDVPDHPFFSRRNAGFRFSGSWSCNLLRGGYHNNHVHPEGWISSAYYIEVPEGVRNDDQSKAGWFTYGQSNLLLGETETPLGNIYPEAGSLILFPSYLWHGTVPFSQGSRRLTAAFDAVPQ